MAKQSALDAKVAEIDAAMAVTHAELNRLREIRQFLTSGQTAPSAEQTPKPKRGRGKGKKGLPVFDAKPAAEDESTRMAV